MKKFLTLCFVVLVITLFSQKVVAEESMRTWTSKDGTESVEGIFQSLNNGTVTILLADKHTLKFPLTNLRDEDARYIQTALGAKGNTKVSDKVSLGALGDKLAEYLVDGRGNTVELSKRTGDAPKFYILYYSASWCPPCRKFTPELVRWYGRSKSKYPVEVVLIPSDKSEEEMLQYMTDYRMRFPGLKFGMKGSSWVPRNESGGIPALVLVDADGKRLLTSQDVPRSDFLKEAEKLITD